MFKYNTTFLARAKDFILFRMLRDVTRNLFPVAITSEKLSAIKAMLEKDHAIDCILLLYLNRGRWMAAKDWMTENKLSISAGTHRFRMIEIEKLGLAKSEQIDPLKKIYKKTELGDKVAKLLLKFFDELTV